MTHLLLAAKPTTDPSAPTRLAVPAAARAWFAVAGLALAAYPLLRPWGAESDPATFASTLWPVSHALGVVGFVALAVALRILAGRQAEVGAASAGWNSAGRGSGSASGSLGGWRGQPFRKAESRAWLAVAGLLPYYGAEAFGLHALGAYVVGGGDSGALAVADDFRYGTLPMTFFAVGLVSLAFVGARVISGWGRTLDLPGVGAWLAGLGLLTYLPQFFTPGPVRIAHGVALGAGLVILALVPRRAA